MSNSNQSTGVGAGFVLFCIFLILKLTNTIDWSWWWVTCPLWAGLALFLVFVFGVSIIAGICSFFRR